jgi:hypothetical protein
MKKVIGIGIILFLLIVCLLPSISGKEIIYIDKPTNVSTIVTVNENFSVNTRLIFTFINSFNQPARVEYYFPIIDYVGGDFDLYATNSSTSVSIVNATRVYVLNGTLLPHSDISHSFNWYRLSSENNPSDGIYKLDVGHFSSLEGILTGEIEVRIPLQKGNFDYLKEPISYEIPPKNQYRTDKHLILYWGEEIEQTIHLRYSYEFNLNRFISNHPLEMMILSVLLGVILGIFADRVIIRFKSKNKKQRRIKK